MMNLLVFSFLLLWTFVPQAFAKKALTQLTTASGKKIQVFEVATGLGVPWGMTFLDNESLLISSKAGKFHHLNLKDFKVTPISGSPEVYTGGQGGLLDVIVSPDFDKNKKIYFTYAVKKSEGKTTALGSAIFSKDGLKEVRELFVANAYSSDNVHFGSRLAFDLAGNIFMSIGDRGKRDRAQILGYHTGKILRLDQEGKALGDNPFVKNKEALPEIWSYGHRNPQGLFYDKKTNKLYEGEHGPRGGDEINLIEAGKNYGWPVVTYGREYHGPKISDSGSKPGIVEPLKYYVPSIAPCGLMIYQGELFPEWKGDFFQGALVLKHLNHVSFKNNKIGEEKRYLEDLSYRVRNVAQSPDGYIYLATDNGKILRLEPL